MTTGVINPIEVDKTFKIITGERRWRASKIAGLKTVPVKILEIDKDERLVRKVIENIHNDTMDFHETSHALDRLRKSRLFHQVKQPKGGRPDEGVSWLAKTVGMKMHLDLLATGISKTKVTFEMIIMRWRFYGNTSE